MIAQSSEPIQESQESQFDARVKRWIDQYGVATVMDTIRGCELEWSYSGKPTRGAAMQDRFYQEVERQLSLHRKVKQ
jgi:hypothetical protein